MEREQYRLVKPRIEIKECLDVVCDDSSPSIATSKKWFCLVFDKPCLSALSKQQMGPCDHFTAMSDTDLVL